MLQYTSGLPDIKWNPVHSDTDNWKDLHALTNLDFTPGSSYAYNNNNTFLRRQIIAKVSGLSFNDFVLKKILPLAGIKNGAVDPTTNDRWMARSFNDDFKQDGLDVPITGWTCLNLYDFYKWAQCINRFCVINPASTRQIITPAFLDKQSGLGSGTMKGDKVITHVHEGKAMHYEALEYTNADKGRTIIILVNQKQDNVYEIATAIEAILDGEDYKALTKTNDK